MSSSVDNIIKCKYGSLATQCSLINISHILSLTHEYLQIANPIKSSSRNVFTYTYTSLMNGGVAAPVLSSRLKRKSACLKPLKTQLSNVANTANSMASHMSEYVKLTVHQASVFAIITERRKQEINVTTGLFHYKKVSLEWSDTLNGFDIALLTNCSYILNSLGTAFIKGYFLLLRFIFDFFLDRFFLMLR